MIIRSGSCVLPTINFSGEESTGQPDSLIVDFCFHRLHSYRNRYTAQRMGQSRRYQTLRGYADDQDATSCGQR